MNILELNDDCLESICEQLSLTGQIRAARTCRRIRGICVTIWYRQKEYQSFDVEDLRATLQHNDDADLKFFVQHIQDLITDVYVKDTPLAFMKLLENFQITQLPSVEKFKMYQGIECYPTDEEIQALSELMPNIKVIYISQCITGKNLTKFQHLNELHLYGDEEKDFELDNAHLRDIFEHLDLHTLDVRNYGVSTLQMTHIDQCRHLKVLKLNVSALKPIVQTVMNLPSLKQLMVMLDQRIDVANILNIDTYDHRIYETSEFFDILKARAEHIIGLSVDNFYMPLTPHWDEDLIVLKYNKLEKFVFNSCNLSNTISILSKYAESSPKLKLLCLHNWMHLTDEAVLLFVRACQDLEHLDVTYCNMLTRSLLYRIVEILQQRSEQLKQQLQQKEPVKKQPILKMYFTPSCDMTQAVKNNSKFWNEQKALIQFPDSLPEDTSDWGYIERGYAFEFK